MIEIFKLANDDNMFGHYMKNKLDNLDKINFIRNENTRVEFLTSYKLHYFSKINLPVYKIKYSFN